MRRFAIVAALLVAACVAVAKEDVAARPGCSAPSFPTADVVLPTVIHKEEPLYPPAERRRGEEGTVVLQAVICDDGSIGEVVALEATGPAFESAAIKAARQWRYRPATANGRPIAIYFTLHVRFSIHSGAYYREPVIEDPRLLKDVRPEYPASLLHERRLGAARIEVDVSAKGEVEDVKVLGATHPAFAEAAVAAARRWAFVPGRGNGRPIRTTVRMSIPFRPPQLPQELTAGGEPEPILPTSDVTLPVLKHRVDPLYPDELRQREVEGFAVLKAEIRRDGTVGSIEVLKATHDAFARAAIDSAKQWKYDPARQHEEPVAVWFTIRVGFALTDTPRSPGPAAVDGK